MFILRLEKVNSYFHWKYKKNTCCFR